MSFPSKTKQLRNHHFDSEKWDCVNYRDDDIVIATAYKSGTTWMQNIVLKLIYQGRELPGNAAEMAPWVDLRVPPAEVLGPMLEGMPDRRQLKTHLPADALKYSEKAKYIYIGRDGRDCFMSLMNHWKCGNEIWYGVLNGPGLLGDPMPEFEKLGKTEGELFDDWISKGWPTLEGETDGWPFWSLFDNVASWWPTRDMPNVCFIHFNDMKADLAGSVRKIAAFLDIPILEDGFDALVSCVNQFFHFERHNKCNLFISTICLSYALGNAISSCKCRSPHFNVQTPFFH
jgi:aryl sulfotransferase